MQSGYGWRTGHQVCELTSNTLNTKLFQRTSPFTSASPGTLVAASLCDAPLPILGVLGVLAVHSFMASPG